MINRTSRTVTDVYPDSFKELFAFWERQAWGVESKRVKVGPYLLWLKDPQGVNLTATVIETIAKRLGYTPEAGKGSSHNLVCRDDSPYKLSNVSGGHISSGAAVQLINRMILNLTEAEANEVISVPISPKKEMKRYEKKFNLEKAKSDAMSNVGKIPGD